MKLPLVFGLLLLLILFNFDGVSQAGFESGVILYSQFSSELIIIDGEAEPAWDGAKNVQVEYPLEVDLSKPAVACKTTGQVRSLWDGALLYLFITVNDEDISTSAGRMNDQDGIEIYIDLWNDKYPKYEEDDGVLFLNAKGERMTNGTDVARFGASVIKPVYNVNGKQTGYNIEMAFHLGGIHPANNSKIGLEIAINDASSENNKIQYKIFWSSTENSGLNDNSKWGTVVLTGYDGKSAKAIDDYCLKSSIQKAEEISPGIWQNEEKLIQALKSAKEALNRKNQNVIDSATIELDLALQDLRRKGPFPDPYDLPYFESLPDPFTFQNGKYVTNVEDWEKRKNEIKELAQYYEYGKMPNNPKRVTSTLNDKKMVVSVEDHEKKVEFEAQLTLPPETQNTNRLKFPVVVSIDFFIGKADTAFLNAGYAVLNFRYSSVASDNAKHTGPFYELYPYNVSAGNDAGTLLAWAWGASRCVDALEYLTKNDSVISNTLDLDKIVITGFSRCGKAALAAGLFDKRFGVVNPGASGCGGAAVYRYVSFGNRPQRSAPYGNEYSWGTSPGCEVLGDKIRHQGHNSNAMLERFLEPGRIYKTNTFGYGNRLPYDHHEIIAAIAPRAVLITAANDDYANNAEGDAIGFEGAKPVFYFLGVPEKLAFNVRTTGEASPYGFGGGHWQSAQQIRNLISFSDMVFYKKPLPENLKAGLYSNPYLPTFAKYYGGLKAMMPWLDSERSEK